MRKLRALWIRLGGLLRATQADHDFSAEIDGRLDCGDVHVRVARSDDYSGLRQCARRQRNGYGQKQSHAKFEN